MNHTDPPHSSDHEQVALRWMLRLTSGTMTTQERVAFNHWIHAHPTHRQAFEELRIIWKEADNLTIDETTGHFTVQTALQPTRRTRPRTNRFAWKRLAAFGSVSLGIAVLVIWITGWQWWFLSDYTTREHQQTIRLASIATIELDAQSALDIVDTPGKTLITLHAGAAWFTVTASPLKHVVEVHTNQATVTSIGTEFLVENRSGQQLVAVTQHAVALAFPPANRHSVDITEGYGMSNDSNDDSSWKKFKIDPGMIGSWRHGRLIVDNMPLYQVIQRLDDYHTGVLVITDPTLRHQKVSGVFDINHPAEALKSLQLAIPINIHRLSSYLTIISKA